MTAVPMRRVLGVAALGCFSVALFAAGPVRAVPYVLYYHTFGDWAVVCWEGLAEGTKSCFIDAPPIAFNSEPETSAIRIQPADKGINITISARSGTRSGTKVRLVVDGIAAYEGSSDRIDHVSFDGNSATAMVDVFKKGHSLAIELPELNRSIHLSLIGFEDAYTAFEENLDRYEPRQ
jgi:invasion protein IalB